MIWSSTMILKPCSAAIIAAGLLRLNGFLLPSALAPIFTWHLRIPFQIQPYQFTFTVAQPLTAAMIVIVTVINYFGVHIAVRFQILLTSLKVAAVAAIALLKLTLGRASGTVSAMTALPAIWISFFSAYSWMAFNCRANPSSSTSTVLPFDCRRHLNEQLGLYRELEGAHELSSFTCRCAS